MLSWFKGLLEESPGVPSTARVVLWMLLLLCVAVPVGLELHLSLKAGVWVEIPSGLSTFLTAVFASGLAGKVCQAIFGEK